MKVDSESRDAPELSADQVAAFRLARHHLATPAPKASMARVAGDMCGAQAQINLTPVLRNRLTITGSTLRPRTVEQKAAIAKSLREHVWPLFESGQLKTFVNRTFPLADARAAHELMESSAHTGKIMLEVKPG